MTAPLLLAYIHAALLLQLGLGFGLWLWRRGSAARQPGPVPASAPHAASGAWSLWREFRVARRQFEDPDRTQCSFYLEPVDGMALPAFKPGQFLTFALVPADADAPAQGGARMVTRCYSLSDRPEPSSYRVTIKRITGRAGPGQAPPGVCSSYFHDRVHEGTVLRVKAPSGHFFIDPDPAVPAVLVAGGIGITPMMSMLRWSLAQQSGRTVHLYYGLRRGGEHAFKQTLEDLARSHPNFHLHTVYSRPDRSDRLGQDYQLAGHVDVELLRRTLPPGRHQFYLCGPAAMMQSLVPALALWGVPSQDIHYEAFGPASVRLEPAQTQQHGAGAPVQVRFARSGRTLNWDGQDESLLEFAQRHGIVAESGCRAGSCGSCETRLISGSVRYAHPPDHEVAPGHCLLCVGTPASALELEA